jgi:uncharacterized protein
VKTTLITGASSGIGLELAYINAQKGNNAVLIARNNKRLEEIKHEIENKYKTKVYIIAKDLSIKNAPLDVYTELKQKNIQIDYLINNAGFGDYGMFTETSWEKEEQMINLNISALTQFTKLFLKDMVARGNGKIMNVASIASFIPGPLMAVYFATKSYVLHFSEAINNEVQGKGVTITALCPGPTESGFQNAAAMQESKMFEGKKIPSSLEVAKYGYDAMIKGKSVAVHGFMNNIMVNSVRFTPRNLIVKIVRSIQG